MPSEFLTCLDCKEEFEFTEGEQAFYNDKGFSLPKRCPDCREKKKRRMDLREKGSK